MPNVLCSYSTVSIWTAHSSAQPETFNPRRFCAFMPPLISPTFFLPSLVHCAQRGRPGHDWPWDSRSVMALLVTRALLKCVVQSIPLCRFSLRIGGGSSCNHPKARIRKGQLSTILGGGRDIDYFSGTPTTHRLCKASCTCIAEVGMFRRTTFRRKPKPHPQFVPEPPTCGT